MAEIVSNNKISYYKNSFIEQNCIRRGKIARVFQVQNKYDYKDYAVKKSLVKGNLKSMLKDVKVWSNLDDNNYIIRYKSSWIECGDWMSDEENKFQTFTNQTIYYIQMELCSMTLREALNNHINKELDQSFEKGVTPIGAFIATQLFAQILSGMHFLHSQKPSIIHRDLKLNNILISHKYFIKISGFCLSPICDNQSMGTSDMGKNEIIEEYRDKCGNVRYKANKLRIEKYDTSTDMYSLGVILCELFCIKTEDFKSYCDRNERDFRYYPVRQIKVLYKLLQEWSSKRPNCEQLLRGKNEWAVNFDEIKLSDDLRKFFYKWWERLNIITDIESSVQEEISAQLLIKCVEQNICERLKTKCLHENNVTTIYFNEFKQLRKVIDRIASTIDELSNITDKDVRTKILKIVLHAVNICEGFENLCYFIESELNENLPNHWHCFLLSHPKTENLINWYECPFYSISFSVEITEYIRIVIINTPIIAKASESLIGNIKFIRNTLNNKITEGVVWLIYEALKKFKYENRSIPDMQTQVRTRMNNVFSDETWNCYISQNELISLYNIYPTFAKLLAIRISNFCILIVNYSLGTIEYSKIKDWIRTSDDRNVIEYTFWPQIIHSIIFLKQFQLSDEKLCFIRFSIDAKQALKKYINHNVFNTNVQLLWVYVNDDKISDNIICEKLEIKIFRRHLRSENKTIDLLKKLLCFYNSDYNINDEIMIKEFLKLLQKFFSSEIFYIFKDKKYKKLFKKLLCFLLFIAKNYLNLSKLQIITNKSEFLKILYVLLYAINYYIFNNVGCFIKLIINEMTDIYVELLKSGDDNICFYAIIALTKLYGHGIECYKKCAETNLFNNALALFKPSISIALMKPLTALLLFPIHFTIISQHKLLSIDRAKNILTLANLLMDHTNDIIVWNSIEFVICLIFNESQELIIESGVMSKILQLLMHNNQQILTRYFGLLALISDYYILNDKQISAHIFNHDIYKKLSQYLSNDCHEIKFNSLRILSIILFENNEQVQTLIDANIIEALIDVINNSHDKCKIIAIRAISNISKMCSYEQGSYILKEFAGPCLI